jgi:hypothetical protein
MKHLKKFIAPTILITIVVGLFYFADREKYFIGKSYFDYKLLPYGLRPEYYCNPYKMGDHMKYEFKIKVNGFEDYGEGTACYCDSTRDRYFIIKRIVGYYFSENSFYAVCYDTNNKLHYIAPFIHGKGDDIVFINAVVAVDSLKTLRYIQAPDPITVDDYYENYNLWKRITLCLKLQ